MLSDSVPSIPLDISSGIIVDMFLDKLSGMDPDIVLESYLDTFPDTIPNGVPDIGAGVGLPGDILAKISALL
jgi:hypothetical protein